MNTNKKTLVVNIWGGPGVGKSVTTAGLYSALAVSKNYSSVAYVSEYAKDLVWKIQKGNTAAEEMLLDQMHVSETQVEKVLDVCGLVDIIVTDSPIQSGKIYHKMNCEAGLCGSVEPQLNKLFEDAEKQYDEINILLKRAPNAAFQKEGRVHDLEESRKADGMIGELLDELGRDYIVINNKFDIASVIGKIEEVVLMKHLNKKQQIESLLVVDAHPSDAPIIPTP